MKHDRNLNAAARAAMHLETKSEGDALEILSKNFGDMADETVRKLKEHGETLEYVADKVDVHEKRLAKSFGSQLSEKPWGSRFVDECDIKALAESSKGSAELTFKTLTTGPTSGDPLDNPIRDLPVPIVMQNFTIRDLMNVTEISSGSVEYAFQTSRSNGADTVAETTLKPDSDQAWELRTVSSTVIAHWQKAAVRSSKTRRKCAHSSTVICGTVWA